jgi:hypothetical protein
MKYKVIAYVLFIAISGILVFSCNRPKEVLSKKEMEKLMYDIYIAEAMIENDYATFDTPEKKEAFMQQVFRKHGVTEAQWDTSLSWYADHIDIYLKINDSIKARILREQKNIEQQITQQYSRDQEKQRKNQSPSYIPPIYNFAMMGSKSGFSFALNETEISKQIDQNDFDFRFDVIGLSQQIAPKLTSMLILEYRDTIIYKNKQVTSNQSYSISASKYIPNDTLQKLSGFIHLQDRMNLNHTIQIYNISLSKRQNFEPTNQTSTLKEANKKQHLKPDPHK